MNGHGTATRNPGICHQIAGTARPGTARHPVGPACTQPASEQLANERVRFFAVRLQIAKGVPRAICIATPTAIMHGERSPTPE